MRTVSLLPLFSTIFVSCTSAVVRPTAPVDFVQAGRSAGREGRSADLPDETTAAADFSRGYEEGLASFCTRDSGYAFGQRGLEYRKVCPLALEPAFMIGYIRGRAEYSRLESRNRLIQALVSDKCDVDVACEEGSASGCGDSLCEF